MTDRYITEDKLVIHRQLRRKHFVYSIYAASEHLMPTATVIATARTLRGARRLMRKLDKTGAVE